MLFTERTVQVELQEVSQEHICALASVGIMANALGKWALCQQPVLLSASSNHHRLTCTYCLIQPSLMSPGLPKK